MFQIFNNCDVTIDHLDIYHHNTPPHIPLPNIYFCHDLFPVIFNPCLLSFILSLYLYLYTLLSIMYHYLFYLFTKFYYSISFYSVVFILFLVSYIYSIFYFLFHLFYLYYILTTRNLNWRVSPILTYGN